MKEVTFLEKLAENLLEGGFAQILKARLQPVQIAKALAREMEQTRLVGPEAPLVSNQYVAYLHPEDLAAFAGFQAGLERELADYLTGYAARRGFKHLAPPSVRLLAATSPCKPGRVRVEASMTDPQTASPAADRPAITWEGTAELPAMRPKPRAGMPAPAARLLDEEGRTFNLGRTGTSLGRALDNDIVLESAGISRHHARILWESGRYVLLDLESTNGTFVRGERVARHPLAEGDQISFGQASFTFRLDECLG